MQVMELSPQKTKQTLKKKKKMLVTIETTLNFQYRHTLGLCRYISVCQSKAGKMYHESHFSQTNYEEQIEEGLTAVEVYQEDPFQVLVVNQGSMDT